MIAQQREPLSRLRAVVEAKDAAAVRPTLSPQQRGSSRAPACCRFLHAGPPNRTCELAHYSPGGRCPQSRRFSSSVYIRSQRITYVGWLRPALDFVGKPPEGKPLPPGQASEVGRPRLGEEITLKGLGRGAGKGDREIDAMVRLGTRLTAADAGIPPADSSPDSERPASSRWRIRALNAIEGEHARRDVACDNLIGDRQDEGSNPVIVDHVPRTSKRVVGHVVRLSAARVVNLAEIRKINIFASQPTGRRLAEKRTDRVLTTGA